MRQVVSVVDVNADAWCSYHFEPFTHRKDINLAQATVTLTQLALKHGEVKVRLSFDPEATPPTRERLRETQVALAAVSPICCLLPDEVVVKAIEDSVNASPDLRSLDMEMRRKAAESKARRVVGQ